MPKQKGKRNCDRYDQQALISWSYFNAKNLFSAKLRNYCESGLCFESEIELQPGTGIYIRFDKLPPNPNGHQLNEGFRTVTLGEVRWCRGVGAIGSHKYISGVKYYEPDY